MIFIAAMLCMSDLQISALLLFVCPGDPVKIGSLCALVVLWFTFRTMNGGSLIDLANNRNYPILYMASRGNLSAAIGFALGLVVGLVAVSTGIPEIMQFYVPLALVALFVITSLLFLPFGYESSTVGYKTLALIDMHESADTSLRETCEVVARRCKLSPRESEVLTYLVKGRNAKHIAEKLFLSESTVKTHISNIYRKAGVHSQQELLDKLDEVVI